nr:MAG TPA: hypothetical protein [Caudoviricetes sp.]
MTKRAAMALTVASVTLVRPSNATESARTACPSLVAFSVKTSP